MDKSKQKVSANTFIELISCNNNSVQVILLPVKGGVSHYGEDGWLLSLIHRSSNTNNTGMSFNT